jgi:hypothetical protein
MEGGGRPTPRFAVGWNLFVFLHLVLLGGTKKGTGKKLLFSTIKHDAEPYFKKNP